MSYTLSMEWDPDKLQVDTLLPDDPRLHIGTITADKVRAGSLNANKVDIVPLPFREGSS